MVSYGHGLIPQVSLIYVNFIISIRITCAYIVYKKETFYLYKKYIFDLDKIYICFWQCRRKVGEALTRAICYIISFSIY